MRFLNLLIIFSLASKCCFCQGKDLKEGDVIFQRSLSAQGKLIAIATHSSYTHCGVLFLVSGQWEVLEAIEPVKFTPFNEWVSRGLGKKYVVKRLKNDDQILTPSMITQMRQEGNKMLGKHYDLLFDWSDDKLYCSELVWKIYKHNAGIELGKLQRLREFDLTDMEVRKAMAVRYGTKIPYEEQVISPAAIFNSPLLIQVVSE